MPQRHITEAVLKAVRALPHYPQRTVLDLSCGDAEILDALAADGCEVRGSRFCANDYIVTELEPNPARNFVIDNEVDLTKPLRYDSDSFDTILLTEVLEHLPEHSPVLSEASRVLKPGGVLLMTTPNIHRLHSRWWFFLTGSHKLICRRVGWDLKPQELYEYHRNPVDFPYVHTLLHQCDLSVKELRFTRFKLKHAFWLLFYPLFAVACFWEYQRRFSSPVHERGERDLKRWMTSLPLLASEQLFVVARKGE